VSRKVSERRIVKDKGKSQSGEEDTVVEVCTDLYGVYHRLLMRSVAVADEETRKRYEQFASRLKRLMNDVWRLEYGKALLAFRRGRSIKNTEEIIKGK